MLNYRCSLIQGTTDWYYLEMAPKSIPKLKLLTELWRLGWFKVIQFGILDGDNNGIVVGHTATVAVAGDTPEVQILGTDTADSSLFLHRGSANATPPFIFFGKGRDAIGTFTTAVSTADVLGEIRAYGSDGVDFNSNSNASAAIQFLAVGTIAADRVPGEIRFRTATNAAPSVITTALTIDNAQTTIVADGFVLYVGVKATPGTTLGANWIGLEDSGTDPLAMYTPDAGDSLDFLHADGTTDSLGT